MSDAGTSIPTGGQNTKRGPRIMSAIGWKGGCRTYVLTLAKDVRMDILRETHCLLPLYLPVLESGIEVKRGDKIVATCLTEVSENNVNPNYRITGDVLSGCRKIPFRVNSEHRAKTYGSSALYERLLRSF